MSRFQAVNRQQDGVAMVVVVCAMAIMSILAAVVLSQSVTFGKQSSNSRDSQRAFAAAEAGLQVARYRLNRLSPADGKCLTASAVDPVAGECPAYTGTLGNGATFSYTVTPAGTTQCGGPALATGAVARCMTSTGTMNGAKRRSQMRVDGAVTGKPLFPLNGMIGINGVAAGNGTGSVPVKINAPVGTDGLVSFGNHVEAAECQEPASAPAIKLGNFSSCPRKTITSTWASQITPVESLNVGGVTFAGSATTNNNAEIPSYPKSGNVIWTPSTRSLVVDNTSSLTLCSAGKTCTYNFCTLLIKNSATLSVASGSTVRIFIDAPLGYAASRLPDSGCPPKTGTLDAGNGFISNSGAAENLQIYVYGWDNGSNVVSIGNLVGVGGPFNATLYAPRSEFRPMNGLTMTGAVVAGKIVIGDELTFNSDAGVSNIIVGGGPVKFTRAVWRECRSNPTVGTDPESGCS